jgi:hypothetical protein
MSRLKKAFENINKMNKDVLLCLKIRSCNGHVTKLVQNH